ncbi:hypothetical protein AAG570_010116 [Ranatra chinensis]|uniref:Cytochrome P450 n=1 Tax=Ranatra chinensis TaxID=642074 RepID=A0ABD0YLR8_9HEMI
MPSAPGLPLVGTSLSVLAAGQKLHLYVDERHRTLGPVYREKMGPVTAVFLSDPSSMRKIFSMEGKYPHHFVPEAWLLYNEKFQCKRGLLFMEGEEWLKYRRVMNKYLLKNDISRELNGVYMSVVEHLVERLKMNCGNVIANLEHELYRHSVSFILATLMGSSYITEMKYLDKEIDKLATIFSTIFETSAQVSRFPAKLTSALSLPVWNRFVAAVDASLNSSKNMLSLMAGRCAEDGLYIKLLNEGIEEDIMRSLIVDLMLAAGDTTAYATQWALYLLGKDKEVQEKLVGDIDGSLTKGVIKETLRMYPSAIFISRILPQPTTILGFPVSAGELILLSLYTSGRSKENFPEPEKFWPERWGRTKNGFIGVNDINAYLPFALGVRSCVGRKIAETQMSQTIFKVSMILCTNMIEKYSYFLDLQQKLL